MIDYATLVSTENTADPYEGLLFKIIRCAHVCSTLRDILWIHENMQTKVREGMKKILETSILFWDLDTGLPYI